MQPHERNESSVVEGVPSGLGTERRWGLYVALQLQLLQAPLAPRWRALYREIARAERDAEISEFHALACHALLAMAEGSGFAADYLEMAEAVAASASERAAVASARSAHDWIRARPSGTLRCLARALGHDHEARALWRHLQRALHRLGRLETASRAASRGPHAA